MVSDNAAVFRPGTDHVVQVPPAASGMFFDFQDALIAPAARGA